VLEEGDQPMMTRCLLGAVVILSAAAVRAEEATEQPAAEPNAGERLVAAIGMPPTGNIYSLAGELDRKLMHDGEEADKTAGELLAVTGQVTSDAAIVDYIETLAKEKPTLAARLLLQVARAGQVIRGFDGASLVIGRLIIEDEKLDPTTVFAQMPILPEGYFAGEIGDRKQPLSFRAHGYEDLDVPLSAEESSESDAEGAVVLKDVVLRPVSDDRRATLRGRVVLDASQDASSATLTLNVGVPPINTPHGGYSPRMSWPEGIKVEVDASGAFTAAGLSPSKYNVMISADEHVTKFQPITLAAGETTDAGDVRLFASDLGFYIGHEAPETPELAWEADFKTALER
jgi:hypothetical protein